MIRRHSWVVSDMPCSLTLFCFCHSVGCHGSAPRLLDIPFMLKKKSWILWRIVLLHAFQFDHWASSLFKFFPAISVNSTFNVASFVQCSTCSDVSRDDEVDLAENTVNQDAVNVALIFVHAVDRHIDPNHIISWVGSVPSAQGCHCHCHRC